jgi:hypothetical protein
MPVPVYNLGGYWIGSHYSVARKGLRMHFPKKRVKVAPVHMVYVLTAVPLLPHELLVLYDDDECVVAVLGNNPDPVVDGRRRIAAVH